ncbi:hypothetical protein BC828DRAFT_99289 [Blastocladiella britannica]|nr:hypothetical protein BC828DRAFT_99289 [Blastocladiella britannica]
MDDPTPTYAIITTGLHCISWASTIYIAYCLNVRPRHQRAQHHQSASYHIEALLWVYFATIDISHISINVIHATETTCAGQPTTFGIGLLDPTLPCASVWLEVVTDCLEAVASPVYPLLLIRLATQILPAASKHALRNRSLLRLLGFFLILVTVLYTGVHLCASLPAFGIGGDNVKAAAYQCSDFDRSYAQLLFCGSVVLAQFFSVAHAIKIMGMAQLRHPHSSSAALSFMSLRSRFLRSHISHSRHQQQLQPPPERNAEHKSATDVPWIHDGKDLALAIPAKRFKSLLRMMRILFLVLVAIVTFVFSVAFFWSGLPNILFTASAWLGMRFACIVYYLAIKNVTVLVLLRRQLPNPDAGTLAATAWVQEEGAATQMGDVATRAAADVLAVDAVAVSISGSNS